MCVCVCDVCICWALWVECGALWQSMVHQSDTSMLCSVREVWYMFAGLCCHCSHQLDTYALKLCESCLFCVFWVLWPSPVTSCFRCIARHEVLTAFILIGFVRNRSDCSDYMNCQVINYVISTSRPCVEFVLRLLYALHLCRFVCPRLSHVL